MLFPTFTFFFFFAIVFLLYWYVFRQEGQRKILLLLASYVFYASWDVRFCLLLFTVTIINYLFALILSKEKEYKVRVVVISVITLLNVLYLFCFKYLYDVMALLSYMMPSVFDSTLIPHLASSLFLPIGISYYTFKCISYTFDVYRCKMRIGKEHFIDTLLYVSFFPQLASGPIVHATYFFTHLKSSLSIDKDYYKVIELDRAMLLLMSGLFKKLILSSFLTILVCDKVFASPSSYNTLELIIGMLAFTIVIYADFSGYSDLSIAIALLLGFPTPKNFNRPYLAPSISEFWRRWHISFSTWLKDYVYFSLGGSRYSLFRTSFALIFTMLIAGLWHGMRLTFLIWGLMQGILLAIEKIVIEYTKIKKMNLIGKEKIIEKRGFIWALLLIIRIFLVFVFTNISWLIFKSDSIGEVITYITSFSQVSLPFKIISPLIFILLTVPILMQVPTKGIREKIFNLYVYIPLPIKTLIFSVFVIFIHLISTSSVPPFIYFAF